MKGSLWIVAVLVVVFAVGTLAIPAQITEETSTQTITNEEQTLDQQNASFLDSADDMVVLYENETVKSLDGSQTYEEGNEYKMDYDRAQIFANDSRLDGETVEMNYSYEKIDDERTNEIALLIGLIDPILGWVIIASILGLLIALLGWF